MANNIPKTHLFTEQDSALIQLSYTFALAAVWLHNSMEKSVATFDLVVRRLPEKRNFLVAGGLEEILTWLQRLRFSPRQLDYLQNKNLIDKPTRRYLENFRFTGTVWAMPEGTIFFGQEPFVRITAPIVEAALLETWIMTAACSNTIFFTKAARLYLAGKNRYNIGISPIRGFGFESSFKATRAGCLCGLDSPATPSFNMKYNVNINKFWINSQHLFVTSFPNELSAFRALARMYPDVCGFLIDTYEPYQGIENAIIVAKELAAKNRQLLGIYIDSGDREALVKFAHKRFKEENLTGIKITVAGGMTEQKIADFVRKKLACDTIGLVEDLMSVNDSAKLDVVYKLAELRNEKNIHYSAKLTPGKQNYPGRKQVFRRYKNNKFADDMIGLENENFGEKLLVKMMDKGKICRRLPNWKEINSYIFSQYERLPKNLRKLSPQCPYRVKISPQVKKLLNQIKKEDRSGSKDT